MYYVDFTDYSKIIERRDNWQEAFRDVFRDKEAVLVKLRELEQIRNDIAHSRELSDLQMDLLRFNCRYLLAAIDGSTPRKAAALAMTAVAAAGASEVTTTPAQ
jgi:hypothetical protein